MSALLALTDTAILSAVVMIVVGACIALACVWLCAIFRAVRR
jgi:hypothetical protein